MKNFIFGLFISTLFAANARARTWQVGLDLLNSAGVEYHSEDRWMVGLEVPFGSETTASRGAYGTLSKLEYSPGIRAGWKVHEHEASTGLVILSLASVKGTGTVNVGPGYPSRSSSGESFALKYSHRWYWERFALGLGGGYRHNSITNVLVPFTGQPDFNIKFDQAFGPVFGEVSVYATF